ncbi:AraC family transcriptional regulator [Oceanobacillus bengalensis]|nr:AraC family transcriptional regulator [Oceanobacillus bengalensis]
MQERIAGIHTLGWEIRNSTDYDWDGRKRWETGKVIFQYTIKGEGEIIINDDKIRLKPGEAFFVNIPSNHRYYLPEDSDGWEFVHITLYGEEVRRNFEEITKSYGNILRMDEDTSPIQLIFNLYTKAVHNEIHDAYEVSSYAYTFLMELHRYLYKKKEEENNKEWPESITKAVYFIHRNFQEPISLDEIVEEAGISKYHFSRLFHETLHITPLNYVTKIRIEKSIELLRNNDVTIEEISRRVGYSNGNYFSKVFRSAIGVSPGKYRNSKSFIPFDQIIQDRIFLHE